MQSLKSRLLNEAGVRGTIQPADGNELGMIIRERVKLLDRYESDQILDLDDIDTSKVTDMSSLFTGISLPSHTIIKLSNWDVSKVTDMYGMFPTGTYSISDLSKWDVSNVKNMRCMFYKAYLGDPLTGLSNWDVSNVTDMSEMFSQCTGSDLKNDISNWDVSNVTDMRGMFYKSKDIKCDLSKWDINPNCRMDKTMFQGSRMKIPEWYKGK